MRYQLNPDSGIPYGGVMTFNTLSKGKLNFWGASKVSVSFKCCLQLGIRLRDNPGDCAHVIGRSC